MNFEQVQKAATILKGHVHKTPVFTSRTLNERVGAEIFLKCENFQRVGAFKFRGGFNAISNLTKEQRQKGVLTFSSGNHGQAIALASKLLGVKATIVMPKNAPATKLAATRGYGAEVIEFDPEEMTREELAAQIQEERNLTVIPPYDHSDVIAGQGTSAFELFQEIANLDMLLTPCGGGGLLSGSALSATSLNPQCKVIGIEPELADDATKSFRTKTLHTVKNPPTIADGTRTPSLGNLTFKIILELVEEMQTVTEEAIVEAVRFLFYRMKLVVEPSGALGVAALLSGAVKPGNRTGIIISGGNVDSETFRKILANEI